MDQRYRDDLATSRLLMETHFLSHARARCLALRDEWVVPDEGAGDLLVEIDQRLRGGAWNLSLQHMPLATVPSTGSVISTLQFTRHEDPLLRREAFRQAVYYVSLETSSQCNRRCAYCPNSINDRQSANHFLSDGALARVVSDLRDIDYDKEVHFVGFNEPMMHADNLLSRIRRVRCALPKARIIVFTNGDYLDRAGLEQLIAAGMDDLVISLHLAQGKAYNDCDIIARINRLAQTLGTPIVPRTYQQDLSINARLVHDRARIEVYQFDYMRVGSNRGELLPDIGPQLGVRTAACLRPMHQFVVGHLGNVMPCCTMVSDDPASIGSSVGTLQDGHGIFDIYGSDAAIAWRAAMYSTKPKDSPCRTCTDFSWPGELNDTGMFDMAGATPDIRTFRFSMTVDRLFFV